MRVAYFAHDLDDPAVARRISMLRDGGAETLLFGFRRGAGPVTRSDAAVLGRTRNGRMLQRVASVLRAGVRLPGVTSGLETCDVVVARNLEMLALVTTSRRIGQLRLPIVYECLDIHRLLSGNGAASRLLRLVEKALLSRCRLIMISSERYLIEHFSKHYRKMPPALLVENKVLASEVGSPARVRTEARSAGPVWRIGWFGVLRCRRTLVALEALASLMPDTVQIVIRGRPARDVIPDFDNIVAKAPGIHFGGPYDRERDLPSIYADVDLIWAVDFYEEGANSDWLLPNRLYESVLYGCIPLVSTSSETGRWLRSRGFDHTLDETTIDGVLAFFAGLSPDLIEDARAQLAAIPRNDVVCDTTQARAIVDRLPRKDAC